MRNVASPYYRKQKYRFFFNKDKKTAQNMLKNDFFHMFNKL